VTTGNRLSGRYTQVPIRGDRGRSGFEVGRDEVNTGGTDYSQSRQVLFTDTHIVSASVVNEARFNYTYGRFTRNFPPGFDAYTGRNLSTEIGLPSLTPGGLPEFITGGGSIGWSQSQQNFGVRGSRFSSVFRVQDLSKVEPRTLNLELNVELRTANSEPSLHAIGKRSDSGRRARLSRDQLVHAAMRDDCVG
jgi:hypothetical protein